MARLMPNDEYWPRLRKVMRDHGVYDRPNLRMMVEGMLYRMRVGCPWRDLPPEFGSWNSIYQKFNQWSLKNKLVKIFNSLIQNPGCEREFMAGSFVKVHQHCQGAAGNENQAIDQSRGGNNTNIHMIVESCGLPLDFELSGGEVHDVKIAPTLLQKVSVGSYIIADRGYDSEAIRTIVRNKGSIPVIPRKRNLKKGSANRDWCRYKYSHLVENVFARLKHFRAIATRYDKLKRNYKSTLALACGFI